jgi:hypothetical protein
MADNKEHAHKLDEILASLKRKFGSISPPVPVAEELHALRNVSTKLKDPDAEVEDHAPFVPATGGVNSTLDTVQMPREGAPLDRVDSDGKPLEEGDPVMAGTRSGHDLNINAGPTEPPKEV